MNTFKCDLCGNTDVLKKIKQFRVAVGMVFNVICLILSMLLVFLHCEDTFKFTVGKFKIYGYKHCYSYI